MGYAAGLHTTEDPLLLRSGAALVLDQDTHEVLYSKNPEAVLPIASLSKLMTALVISEANQPLDEMLGSRTTTSIPRRTPFAPGPGTQLPRGVMLHLALMSSEHLVANALGRNYLGGLRAVISPMNAKAEEFGMPGHALRRADGPVEPEQVQRARPRGAGQRGPPGAAAARILHHAVAGTSNWAAARCSSTPPTAWSRNPTWDIGLQKTGFINEAGQCLVMQAQMAGRKLIMVLLDSAGKYSRIADAERIRKWVTTNHTAAPAPAGPARSSPRTGSHGIARTTKSDGKKGRWRKRPALSICGAK